jgi:hypothetical protein
MVRLETEPSCAVSRFLLVHRVKDELDPAGNLKLLENAIALKSITTLYFPSWTVSAIPQFVRESSQGRSSPRESDIHLKWLKKAVPMKVALIALFLPALFLAAPAFAQAPSAASTAACGPKNVSFNVWLDEIPTRAGATRTGEGVDLLHSGKGRGRLRRDDQDRVGRNMDRRS